MRSIYRMALVVACALAFPASAADLNRYYATLESRLVAKGFLRQDTAAPDAPFGAQKLAAHFAEIALRQEYRGSSLSGGGREKPLLRWEEPVRISVRFGASVAAKQRARDKTAIGRFARRLSVVTGHRIGLARGPANFHVFVVSDTERRGLGGILRAEVPGISEAVVRSVLSMRREHLCMVVAIPHADRRRGYRSAVAIVRAEHGARMRRSCLEEELAQGMGLPNDCKEARPSIFNDNEEFGVLTRHDEMLLAMLYDPGLHSGMTAAEAMPRIRQLSARALGG